MGCPLSHFSRRPRHARISSSLRFFIRCTFSFLLFFFSFFMLTLQKCQTIRIFPWGSFQALCLAARNLSDSRGSAAVPLPVQETPCLSSPSSMSSAHCQKRPLNGRPTSIFFCVESIRMRRSVHRASSFFNVYGDTCIISLFP